MLAASDYREFLAGKALIVPPAGIEVEPEALNRHLFGFQRALTRWALRKGRSALFASTGLGKTLMQLSWAERAAERALILAPLAVAKQTVREGMRFGIAVTYARSQDQAAPAGITVTNYERLEQFDPAAFGAVVLDESSILKAFEGKTRRRLIEAFGRTPMRLCASATPAPNDIAELANHAEFLGIMTRAEMLAAFFIHDDAGWRLKGHGREPFYRWLASWGMSLNKPSDLGYSDEGYDLPPLTIEPEFLPTDYAPPGRLFADRLQGVIERAAVRRGTVGARVEAAAALLSRESEERWICWYGLLEEGRRLKSAVGDGAVFVEGSLTNEEKEARLLAFVNGEARVLVTHPKIGGHGLNLQHCARMAFVGISDSFESYFQCLRRCWRYGQTRAVKAYIVLTEPERVVYENVLAKEREAKATATELVKHVREFEKAELIAGMARAEYEPAREMRRPAWLAGSRLPGTPFGPAGGTAGQEGDGNGRDGPDAADPHGG